MKPTSLELCAGAGGQALGLEQAGFEHAGLVEIDKHACASLRFNRPEWNVLEQSIVDFDASYFEGVDLLAAGLPCPPFSIAGKGLGRTDERNLFPELFRIIQECSPRTVMVENVRGMLQPKFSNYFEAVLGEFESLGFLVKYKVLNAADFGVPQLRPRLIMVGLREEDYDNFSWPRPRKTQLSVGEALVEEMGSDGWNGAKNWAKKADRIGPTLVGGSKKHGGPDVGPTRAKKAWAELGINGHTIAKEPPEKGFKGDPRLTVRMAATIQGFPKTWSFVGAKTNAYRQVGNAFPPPVAKAVGRRIRVAINKGKRPVRNQKLYVTD